MFLLYSSVSIESNTYELCALDHLPTQIVPGAEELELIDLGDAILYLDETGQIKAIFSITRQPDTRVEQCII